MLKINFDHIAVATNSIQDSLVVYSSLDYSATAITSDPIQKVEVCFLTKEGFPKIELVQGIGPESPVSKIISKMGVTPYHQCFSVSNLEDGIKFFEKNGFLKISKIEYASAFSSNIIFLYNKKFGLLELVENEN